MLFWRPVHCRQELWMRNFVETFSVPRHPPHRLQHHDIRHGAPAADAGLVERQLLHKEASRAPWA
ncbi:MAG: hypothetical protein NZM43_08260 [Saprospiraceae bacterium]|nr:hypothetical protein [Saprospiraceae bacterium]MDW8484302.1 hypothetical protein [Saprospiraceae bacterium]